MGRALRETHHITQGGRWVSLALHPSYELLITDVYGILDRPVKPGETGYKLLSWLFFELTPQAVLGPRIPQQQNV
jgi:hypothetical protein